MPRYLVRDKVQHKFVGIVCATGPAAAQQLAAGHFPGRLALIQESDLNTRERQTFDQLIGIDADLRNNGQRPLVIGDTDDIVFDPEADLE